MADELRSPAAESLAWVGACAASLALLVTVSCGGPPADPGDYSLILVTLDTTRADRIGAFGGTAVPTPNLDALAAEGIKFDTAVSQVPLTLPAHSSILTGRYPASHGVRHNGIYRLREEETTLAEHFHDQGFATAAVIGAFVLNKGYGTEQGFRTYDDIPADRYQGGRDNLYEAQRTADEVNARVFEWLGQRSPGRFFLWVHYYDPHTPYMPPEKTGRTLHGRGYDREISYLDSCVGDLVSRLRRDGVLDRAILVVAGDHGESLGEHKERTHGVLLYEGSVRVPLILRAPGLVPEGRTVSGPVELVDIAPTVLELLRLPPLPNTQGSSLVARIHDEGEGAGKLAFAETWMPRLEFGWSELTMVQDARFKYIRAPKPELYDLRSDPEELRNLIHEDQERAEVMSAYLSDWMAHTTDEKAQEGAARTLTSQEEAQLRSLGYLGGDFFKQQGATDGAALPDPKDQMEEAHVLHGAKELLEAGRTAEGLAIVNDLLRRNPMNHLARSSRIQALIHLKRLPEAEEEALAAVAAATQDSTASPVLLEKARRVLASVYWMVGKNKKAEEQYRLAVELNQENKSAAPFGGLLLGAAGGMQEAMRIVEDVLSRRPTDPMAWAAKFELEFARGKKDEAYATSRRLAQLRAGDAETLLKAGKLARDREDVSLAVALFGLANERKPQDPDILGYLGTARLTAGDLDGAETALEAVRKLRPQDPRAAYYLGNIALLRRDEEKARSLYQESLRADPGFIPPLLNLARWLAAGGKYREAVQTVEDALSRRPGNREALRLLEELRSAGGVAAAR